MEKYKIVTEITDFGPYVSKLILEMPYSVRASELILDSFNVYVERCDCTTGEIVISREYGSEVTTISKGYQKPMAVYPCDGDGLKQNEGCFVTLELPEEKLGKRIEGNVMTSRYIRNAYRVTLLHTFEEDPAKAGLIFDECAGELCPQLEGWEQKKYQPSEKKLSYGCYQPKDSKNKLPLVVWLHGAGEGGDNPLVAYTGNKAVNLASPEIQSKLGGAAWILVPQCPTVWMDDGVERLGRSNRSIYVEPLKFCIDQFIAEHQEQIDMSRIYVGGLSNGGFMTMRMLIDYPDFFVGAIPVCECFYDENMTDQMIESIKHIPMWFVHTKIDELVPPKQTALPIYKRLKAAGACNVHFSYYDHMEDLSGRYKDKYGQPLRYFNHAVWVHVLNNHCHTELDGTNVCVDGEPMTIWEWLGYQKRSLEAH